MWNIVAGKTGTRGRQPVCDSQHGVNEKLRWMMSNSDSAEGKHKLEVILRTMQTLTHYVDVMGQQITTRSKVAENEVVLENIHGVSTLVEELVGEYAMFEVNLAEQQYLTMHANFLRFVRCYVGLTALAVGFSILAAWAISRSIYAPIKKLHDVTTTITKNDLAALVNSNNVDEITELGMSFNIMIGRRFPATWWQPHREQEALQKAEAHALQAQINPHFLYNTLDTIIWMAESRRTGEVVEIVRALSSFFRLSLSKGRTGSRLRRKWSAHAAILPSKKCAIVTSWITPSKWTRKPAATRSSSCSCGHRWWKMRFIAASKTSARAGRSLCAFASRGLTEVQLEVEDNGIGMAPDKLARLRAFSWTTAPR